MSTAPGPIVLILGSGPAATQVRAWDLSGFSHVVVINNAWRVRPDWHVLIHPEDFPLVARPARLDTGQRIVEAVEYVPIQNRYGGFVYAGGTMAFTAGYWALGALRPSVMAYFGCNMVYPKTGPTHFYGTGAADPLRADPSLANLEAKSARLELLAALEGCACVNLSDGESRLVFARADRDDLGRVTPRRPDADGLAAVRAREAEIGYLVPSGRYWEVAEQFDPERIAEIDAMWLAAHETATQPA